MAFLFALVLLAFGVTAPAQAQSVEIGGKSYASMPAYLDGAWQTTSNGKIVRMDFTRGGVLVIAMPADGVVHHAVYEVLTEGLAILFKRTCMHETCKDIGPVNPMLFPFKAVEPNKFMSEKEEWERLSNR